MITKKQAQEIVHGFINESDPYWPDKPEMVITEVEDHPLGWLIYWTSSRFLKSNNISDALAGNGPILISRDTGDFETTGSAPPLAERVAEAETRLRQKVEQRDTPKGKP